MTNEEFIAGLRQLRHERLERTRPWRMRPLDRRPTRGDLVPMSFESDGDFTPKLEHTVHASNLEQAHRLARAAGAEFFGVPIEQIESVPLHARADITQVDGRVLTYAVAFVTTPTAVI